MNDWGFTKPEIAESMAYRIEKERKCKVGIGTYSKFEPFPDLLSE